MEILLENQIYVIFAAIIMMIGGIFTTTGLAKPFFAFLAKKLGRGRLALLSLYLFSGAIPVPGRCIITAPVLSGANSGSAESKGRLGVANYIMAHHYYLWSPIEEAVIILMGATGLSYLGFLSYTWPFLVVYLSYVLWLTFSYIKDEDVDSQVAVVEGKVSGAWKVLPFFLAVASFLVLGGEDSIGANIGLSEIFGMPGEVAGMSIMAIVLAFYAKTTNHSFKKVVSYIRWKPLAFLAGILVLGNWIKSHNGDMKAYLETLGTGSVILVTVISGLMAFAMGSSGKYAGLTALLTKAFGISWFPIFMAADYAGYLLSPTHKCGPLACSYFGTKPAEMYKKVGVLATLMVLVGVAVTFLR